jgi:hypothetical protein
MLVINALQSCSTTLLILNALQSSSTTLLGPPHSFHADEVLNYLSGG